MGLFGFDGTGTDQLGQGFLHGQHAPTLAGHELVVESFDVAAADVVAVLVLHRVLDGDDEAKVGPVEVSEVLLVTVGLISGDPQLLSFLLAWVVFGDRPIAGSR